MLPTKKKSFRGWDLKSLCALKWHKVERVGFRPTGGSRTIYFVVKLWSNRIPFSCWNYCGSYIARRILKFKGQDGNSENSKVCQFLNFLSNSNIKIQFSTSVLAKISIIFLLKKLKFDVTYLNFWWFINFSSLNNYTEQFYASCVFGKLQSYHFCKSKK